MSLPERYGGFPDLEGDSYGGRCRDLLPSAAAMALVSSYLTHHKNHHHEIDRSRRRKARSERKKKRKQLKISEIFGLVSSLDIL